MLEKKSPGDISHQPVYLKYGQIRYPHKESKRVSDETGRGEIMMLGNGGSKHSFSRVRSSPTLSF